MVILGIFICAAFIRNIACGEGTSCGGMTHRKTKLSDMHGYEANELKRARKDAVQVLAPNDTQALGADSSSFTTEYAKEDDPDDKKMNIYTAHCKNLLQSVGNGCDPLWINGTLCQDEMQVSNKESDGKTLQESKGANECNNSKESCIDNTAASPDKYLDDTTRTMHGINNSTATENPGNTQDLLISASVDPSLPKNLPTNHSDENHVAESLPNLEETHGTDVPQTASKTPRGDSTKFSYLSFGVNSSIPSFYTCVINAEERISSREKSKNSTDNTMSIDDQKHAKYAFSRIIDIKNSENNILETMIKKEILFGSIEEMVGKIKTKSINLDKLVNESKNKESLYAFFENLNVKDYSCKIIQDLYFLFITYNCLEYNKFLKCGVLREELWEAHVYMSELYPYTLWKMEKINTENEITLENREIYKQNLKEELKLLCIILELYREIKILKIKPDSCSKHQSLINMYVEKLRKVIQMHLESFYPIDQATTLCYIANRMHNQSSTIKSRHKFDKLDSDLLNFFGHGHFTQLVQHSKPSSRKKIDKGHRGLMNLEFFQSIHQLHMVKNTIFILVFTINFANIRPPLDKNQLVTISYIKKQKLSAAEIFRAIFLTKMQYLGLYEIQLNAVLETTRLIKQRRRDYGCQSADINDSFGILQFKKLMEKYKRDCTFSDTHRLILYRLMILKAMVIEFVN